MKIFTLLFLFACSLHATAQTRVRSTATGGNWNSTSTWVGGVIPDANDTTEIVPGATVIVNSNSANTVCGRLEVAGTVTYAADAWPLIINGALIIDASGVFNAVKAGTTFSKAVTIHGSIQNNGVLNAAYAVEGTTSATTGGITMGQAAAISGISGTGTFSVFRQLTIDNSHGVNLNVPLIISGKLVLQNGLFNNRTNLTLNNTATGTGPNGAATSSGNIRTERSQSGILEDPFTLGGSASYFLTYYTNSAGPNPSSMITEGREIPSGRSIHGLTVNHAGGIQILDDLTLRSGSVPLVLTSGIVNVARTKTLICNNASFAGTAGNSGSFVQGGLALTAAATAVNRTYPTGFGGQRRHIVLNGIKSTSGNVIVRFEIIDTLGGSGATGIQIAPTMKRRGSEYSGSMHSFTSLTFHLGSDESEYAIGNIASSATWNGTYQDMGEGQRTLTSISNPVSSYSQIVTYALSVPDLAWSGVMDSLQQKWAGYLTGIPYDISDPEISARVAAINNSGNNLWRNNFVRDTAGRTQLWTDIPYTASEHITTSYTRLKSMAMAYSMPGAALYHNDTLRNDIIWALDWMYRYHYNEHITVPSTGGTNNWWDYRIGSPLRLNDIVVLMYDEIGPDRRHRYMKAVDNSTPNVAEYTGANLAWVSTVIAIRAVIVKSPSKLLYARNSLSPVFQYVTSGDGFYRDGSFIQHVQHPYNGAYGLSLFVSMADVLYLYANTSIDFTDPARSNVVQWVYQAFEPLIYKGAMMSMVRGREIGRAAASEHIKGRNFTETLIKFSDMVSPTDALRMKQMAKHWLLTDDTFGTPYTSLSSIFTLTRAKSILDDPSVQPRGSYETYRQFAGMDRAVQHTANYAIGISMHSTRTYNYEMINGENLKGWHLSDGMTYLYNSDLRQYDNFFWPTVNMYRLPGTTVEENITATRNRNNQSAWAGGTSLLGKYGASGIQLSPYATTLLAKKAWFLFGDKMVALGAGIKNSDNKNVSTYIDQRKILPANTNTFIVNGTTQVGDFGSESTPATFSNTKWAHLSGNVPGADIGYYFPETTTLRGLRQNQDGRWSDVSEGESTFLRTQRYITLWKEHGNHTTDDDASYNRYSYVLLPGYTATETAAFAAAPGLAILRNDAGAQAAYDSTSGITGAVFWGDATSYIPAHGNASYLSANKKAAVMIMEHSDTIAFAVSDPTQLNTGNITIRLQNSATSVLYSSPNISVTRLTPDIEFNVNVSGQKGATSELILSTATSPFMAAAPAKEENDPNTAFQVLATSDRQQVGYTLQTEKQGAGTLTLIDMNGRILTIAQVNVLPGQNRYNIHTPHHAAGMYVAVLRLNGHIWTCKYVK